MKKDLIRIGFIGAGENTRLRHLPGFKAIPGVELSLVANRTEESSARVASEFGIGDIARDWRAVVESPEVDAVCIGTWPYMHAEIGIAALEAGKHVLTEARMARNAREAEEMVRAHQKHSHLVAQVVPAPMTLEFDKTIQRMLEEKTLGEIREVQVVQTNAAQIDVNTPMTWRQDYDLSGHNIMTMGIHYEALLRWFEEDAEVDAVSGAIYAGQRKGADGESKDMQIPETISILGHYPESRARLSIHLSGLETSFPRNEIRINGTEAGIRLDLNRNHLYFMSKGEEEMKVEIADEDRGSWQVEEDFIRSIREGAPVMLTNFETGLRYMRFTDAVWEEWERVRGI